jgi:hypothetical protein
MGVARLWLTLCLLICSLSSEAARAIPIPTGHDGASAASDQAASGRMRIAQAQPAQPATSTPAPPPSPTPAASDEPIGNVATLTGVVTVIRSKDSIALKLKDDIFLNDAVQTAADSTLGITFNDGTTFHLSANAKITIDTYVYEEGAKDNAGIFDIAKGTVAFVAAAVAKTGDMKITTPTSTLGIRGTTGLVEIPEGGAAGRGNNVNIKLYPDPDGHVGRIEVNDRTGARLGALTQGASGFSIRPPGAPGGRISAVPLRISSEQATRDQGFVRQVHAAQNVGRQIVTEQRALRRANPNAAPNRNTPPRQPTPQPQPPQRQNNLPQPKQQGAQPPERNQPRQQGQPPQQGKPPQQGQPQRSGQTPRPGEKPGTTPPPGVPPRPGEAPRPGEPPRPGDHLGGGGQPGAPPRPVLREPPPRQAAPLPPRPGAQRPAQPGRPAAVRGKRPPRGKRDEPR